MMYSRIFSGIFSILVFASGTVGVYGQSVYEPYTFSTFAGTAGVVGSANGTGSAARFASPSQIAVDATNNLYVADTGNHTIRKITPSGVVTTLAGSAGVSGSANGIGSGARFNSPIGVGLDQSGNLYIGDSDNNTIRKITPAGVVTTLAGQAGVAGSANGTGSVARFNGPRGVGLDAAGNIYVADTFNNTIRKVTPAGVVTTLAGLAGASGTADGLGGAARFNRPRGITVDSNSNIFVADTANNTVRRVTLAGAVTTVAGSGGLSGSADGSVFDARFFGPIGIANKSGNIYLADTVNDTIRKISATGAVTTLGGVPVVSGSANGTGSNARFASPQGVILNSANQLFVSDTGNNTIRKGVPVSPSPTPSPSPSPSPSVSPSPSPSPSVSPSPTPSPTPAQPLNISTRARVETDQNVMIGGFIIDGTASKTVIIRGIGPSLVPFGISDALADPVLELRAGNGSFIKLDNDWQDDPAQAALIQESGFAPSNELESAIVATLAPGAYTAIVSGRNRTSGIGLVEVYDLDPTANSILANISTRGFVQTGDNVMIGGFILGQGAESRQVLVRVLGPSLAPFGVVGVLANPTLELRNGDGDLTASNDDWKSLQQTEIEATGLAPSDNAESAVLVNLMPGNYTAVVEGKDGTTGVALVEIYALP